MLIKNITFFSEIKKKIFFGIIIFSLHLTIFFTENSKIIILLSSFNKIIILQFSVKRRYFIE